MCLNSTGKSNFIFLLCKNQLVSFFLIGLLQLLVDSLTMLMLFKVGLYLVLANSISRAVAAILGCYLNYSLTFKENKKSTLSITYVKFVFFWLFMTCLSSVLMFFLSEIFPSVINDNYIFLIVIKILIEAILFFVSFFISKTLVFRSHYES